METRSLTLALLASLAAVVSAFPQASVRVDNATGLVNYPADFWTTNSVVRTNGTYADPAWIATLAKAKVGLANVDNTSDADKPISVAMQSALDGSDQVDHSAINYVFEGDSLSSPSSPDWPSLAILLPAFYGGVKVNAAENGNGIDQLISQYSAQVYPYRPNGTSVKKAYLFVWVGTNNFSGNSNHPLSVGDFLDKWESYIETANSDGFTVVAFTVLRRADTNGAGIVPADEIARQSINEAIRASTIYDLLIDADVLFPDPYNETFFESGALHINATSKQKLADVVNAVLLSGVSASPAPLSKSSPNKFFGQQTFVNSDAPAGDAAPIRLVFKDASSSVIGVYQGPETAPTRKYRFFISDTANDSYFGVYSDITSTFGWVVRNGRVGILNNDPQESLDVAGNCKVSGVFILPGGVKLASGSGTPEGALTAPVGSTFSRTDGGAGTSFYVKESGSGNTGWIAK